MKVAVAGTALLPRRASQHQGLGPGASADAPLTGTIEGARVYRTGINLTAAAEGWIEDARELGLFLIVGPDGNVWRAMPWGAEEGERVAARARHWTKLNDRPPLMRAVYRAVKRGFQPGGDGVVIAEGVSNG